MPSPDTRRGLLPAAVLIGAMLVAGCASNVTPSAAPASSAAATSPPPGSGVTPAPSPPSGSPAPTSPTQTEIERLLAAVAANPDDADSQRDLGFALLQRVRETADPSLYEPAAAAFEAARMLAPDDALVLVGIGGLQLGKHEFADALESGRQAAELSPTLAAARAVIVDALVELGRYDEADAEAAEMFALSTDLSTLARVSYLAELRGKLDIALSAMRLAAESPGLAPENTAYVQALLGNLLVYSGEPASASDAYRAALDLVPAHAPSLAGQARLAVGAGKLDEAIEFLERASEIVPLPEYVIALGDTQDAAGRAEDARRSFALARAEIQLFEASGVVVDLDLALFEADHGDPGRALSLAQAARDAAPTVRAADALAWALHRLGRDAEATPYVDEALRLGSRDPLLRYHAGAVEAALGEASAARRDLELALQTDPGFSATGAREARRLLATLPD
ncbi:MAG: tetratricopeptide repeat protein [Candidatus Limnocylindrales bacterium]|nr:tetratricopeptide repeat protein [Candidatus Limnocylindrales bacterium]